MSETRERQLSMLGYGYEKTAVSNGRVQTNLPDAKITLFTDKNFKGSSYALVYDVSDLGTWRRQANDSISSVIVEGIGKWTLYENARYQGKSVTLEAGRYPDLGKFALDNTISSLLVEPVS